MAVRLILSAASTAGGWPRKRSGQAAGGLPWPSGASPRGQPCRVCAGPSLWGPLCHARAALRCEDSRATLG
ncbi:hypothetical protein ACP26L_06640 [Paenibacillus sp. S-38]|uniref:hypothetical protein n=1 Tax=Paenibacillus sp. S-38 TaxID=3416710 RepID=UPI003CF1D7D8